ncbi:MAG: DNA translocase FtsK [Candidatus Eisenbacteria bacterium]|uniref:DNA translocase FtsK n=1 Tax=Eiseniibacteriota bacterium TaxID=2212470 RepID=A0A938BQM1_UNCEI|nr:DNA translocase FtsK [Candidatus Eisenbacteria bacterium]
MARSQAKPPRRVILGILLLAVSLLTAISLPGLGLGRATGPFGQVWVQWWAGAFGAISVWAWTALGIAWGLAFLGRWRRGPLWRAGLLLAPLIVAWNALLLLLGPSPQGRYGGWCAERLLGAGGAFFGPDARVQLALALLTLAMIALLMFLRWGLPAPVGAWVDAGVCALGRLGRLGLVLLWRAFRALASGMARLLFVPAARALRGLLAARRAGEAAEEAGLEPAGRALGAVGESSAPAPARSAAPRREAPRPEGAGEPAPEPPGWAAAAARPEGEAPRARPLSRVAAGAPAADAPVPAPRGAAVALLELLEERSGGPRAVGDEEIQGNAGVIVRTLESFGVTGEVSEVHPGPVITRYEYTPGPGVTISQISSRQDDLALALRAPRIRLLAPIPGKAAVGIEIPNREPALISFREVAARKEFLEAREPLRFGLGQDVGGRPFYTSLEKMPHLLVAGTTGSGKSVCINTMIVSLLLRCPPERLRLLLIDPKMLELTTYNGIPHLLRPVVTDPREAARGLQWLTREMERRYRVMASLGVRNIESYLARRAPGDADPPLEPLPYIVVFVDELADLMMTNPAEIEIPIARLAQMARAVGIHLVLATQRPSVDVITGVIKANFPARIAFQVATRTDSRTILDSNGAESLVGRGDMLFIPPGKAQAHRLHGAFLSDAETERVASYLRQFPPAEPIGAAAVEEEGAEFSPDMEDSLFSEAVRIVVLSRQGSTSLLQRRLRVGYTRAGRLMDIMERAGIVGPPDGSRAREVLVGPDYLEHLADGEQSPARV